MAIAKREADPFQKDNANASDMSHCSRIRTIYTYLRCRPYVVSLECVSRAIHGNENTPIEPIAPFYPTPDPRRRCAGSGGVVLRRGVPPTLLLLFLVL